MKFYNPTDQKLEILWTDHSMVFQVDPKSFLEIGDDNPELEVFMTRYFSQFQTQTSENLPIANTKIICNDCGREFVNKLSIYNHSRTHKKV